MSRNKLQKLLNKLDGKNEATMKVLSNFDASVKELKDKLEADITMATLEEVRNHIAKLRKVINLSPLVEQVESLRKDFKQNALQTLQEVEEKMADLESLNAKSDELDKEIKKVTEEVTGLSKNTNRDINELSKNISELQDKLDTEKKELDRTLNEIKEDKETIFKKIEEFPTKTEVIERIGHKGVGNANRNITMNDNSILGKYTDINFLNSSTIGWVATVDNTKKRVNIMASILTDTGGGGNPPTSFNYPSVTGALLSTVTVSSIATLAGDADMVWPFVIRGQGTPQLSVNSGSWMTEVIGRKDDTLQARLTSSSSNSVTRIATVYTTGFSTPYSVTTAAFLPTQVSGCQLWVACDLGVTKDGSDFVDSWADQSGNGRNLTNTGTSRPQWIANTINGLPVIRFDGSNDCLKTGSSYDIQEVFIVLNNDNGTTFSHLQTPISNQTISTADDRAFGTCSIGTSDMAEDGFAGATGTYINTVQTENFATLSAYKIIDARRPTSAVTWATSQIGSDGLISGRFWGGDFAEVIVYDNIISAGNRTNLIAYLQNKYNI